MKTVAVGGGHGTAVALRALRRFADEVTGVVSVADNGGSTGRLRDLFDVAAVGDIRKCLTAMADPTNPLAQVMEHRFSVGELEGHPVGNLLLVGMLDATSDNLEESIRSVAELLGIRGQVLPASSTGVTLIADSAAGEVRGQRQIVKTRHIASVRVEPELIASPISSVEAIERADLVVIGPGSLYTSVLAAAVVPGITQAIAGTKALKIYVANLLPQAEETLDMSLNDHVEALIRHGVEPDVVLVDAKSPFASHELLVRKVVDDLSGASGRVHDVAKLASSLKSLVDN